MYLLANHKQWLTKLNRLTALKFARQKFAGNLSFNGVFYTESVCVYCNVMCVYMQCVCVCVSVCISLSLSLLIEAECLKE